MKNWFSRFNNLDEVVAASHWRIVGFITYQEVNRTPKVLRDLGEDFLISLIKVIVSFFAAIALVFLFLTLPLSVYFRAVRLRRGAARLIENNQKRRLEELKAVKQVEEIVNTPKNEHNS